MLKLCRVTKVKVFFLVLVNVFNFDLFEFLAAILALSSKNRVVRHGNEGGIGKKHGEKLLTGFDRKPR